MREFNTFLLSLHSAVRDVPFEFFREHALTLLQSIVPFDAARWSTVTRKDDCVSSASSHWYNDLRRICAGEVPREHDGCAEACYRGAVHRQAFETCALAQSCESIIPTECCKNMYALVFEEKSDETNVYQAISLFRSPHDTPFDETHRAILETVFPHLREALQTCMALQMARGLSQNGDATWAVAIWDFAGYLSFVEPNFRELLQREWPEAPSDTLPPQFASLIGTAAATRLLGREVLFQMRVESGAAFLRARARLPVDDLSHRELEVAQLVVAGLTHKKIAKALQIAPATVRNHLQAIHARVEVHNNAELVRQLKYAGF